MTSNRRWHGLLPRLALAAFLLSALSLGPGVTSASAAVVTPAAPTQPQTGPCDIVPGGLGSLLCNHTVGHAIGSAISGAIGKAVGSTPLGGAVGAVGSAVGNSFFNAADGAVRDGANSVLGSIGKLIAKVQTPNLQSTWFLSGYYDRMVGLVLGVILLLMFIVRVATSSYRSDWVKELSRSFLKLVTAVVLMFVIVWLFQLGLFAADKMAAAMTGQKSGTFITLMQQMLKKSSGSIWLDLVTAGLMFLFAFLLWVELIVRSVCMFAGLLFAPLAFSARIMGEWGDRITWRLMTFLGALVFSLPLMVALLGLGVAVDNNLIPSDTPSARLVAAAFFLFLAFVSPWPLMAWTRHVQATVRGNLAARSSAASAAASGGRAVTAPQRTAQQVTTNLGSKPAGINMPGARVQHALSRVSTVPGATAVATWVAGPQGGMVMRQIRAQETHRRLQAMRPQPREITGGRS